MMNKRKSIPKKIRLLVYENCNHYKATLDVEGFRKYLSEIHKRLMRDSIPYQVAERFGIVKYVSDDVKFYFEELRGGENGR